jgi:hypothetical protein
VRRFRALFVLMALAVASMAARQSPLPVGRARTYVVSGNDLREVDLPGTFRISGHVLDSHDNPPLNFCVTVDSGRDDEAGSSGRAQLDGSFVVKNLTPGHYALEAGPCLDPEHPVPPDAEGAVTTLELGPVNVTGIVIRTHPSISVHGHARFDADSPDPRRPTVSLQARTAVGGISALAGVRHAAVGEDGTFTLRSVFGPRVIRFGLAWPGPDSPWWPGPVLLHGRDITNVPVQFESEPDPELEVVFTQRSTGLSGVVFDPAGQPSTNAYLLVFSSDRALWQQWSSTTNLARSHGDGRFFLIAPPGSYLAVAFPAETFHSGVDAVQDFGALARLAVPVQIVEGQTGCLNLTTRNPRDLK